MTAYSDADFFNKHYEDGKSTIGYAIFITGGLIDWSSKKQSVTVLLGSESEYIAMSANCQQVAYNTGNLDE
eukprot:Ihof_evm20s8 gene=Ihof_evmTU20s8